MVESAPVKGGVRLCILLDGTAAMAQHWAEIRQSYVEPLLRTIDNKKDMMGYCELALIILRTKDVFSDCSLERSTWTDNMAEFRRWLDSVEFLGGGRGDLMLLQGLADSLYMSGLVCRNRQQMNLPLQCVLIASASLIRHELSYMIERVSNAKRRKVGRGYAQALSDRMKSDHVGLSVICTKDHLSEYHMLFAKYNEVPSEQIHKQEHVVQASRVAFGMPASNWTLLRKIWESEKHKLLESFAPQLQQAQPAAHLVNPQQAQQGQNQAAAHNVMMQDQNAQLQPSVQQPAAHDQLPGQQPLTQNMQQNMAHMNPMQQPQAQPPPLPPQQPPRPATQASPNIATQDKLKMNVMVQKQLPNYPALHGQAPAAAASPLIPSGYMPVGNPLTPMMNQAGTPGIPGYGPLVTTPSNNVPQSNANTPGGANAATPGVGYSQTGTPALPGTPGLGLQDNLYPGIHGGTAPGGMIPTPPNMAYPNPSQLMPTPMPFPVPNMQIPNQAPNPAAQQHQQQLHPQHPQQPSQMPPQQQQPGAGGSNAQQGGQQRPGAVANAQQVHPAVWQGQVLCVAKYAYNQAPPNSPDVHLFDASVHPKGPNAHLNNCMEWPHIIRVVKIVKQDLLMQKIREAMRASSATGNPVDTYVMKLRLKTQCGLSMLKTMHGNTEKQAWIAQLTPHKLVVLCAAPVKDCLHLMVIPHDMLARNTQQAAAAAGQMANR